MKKQNADAGAQSSTLSNRRRRSASRSAHPWASRGRRRAHSGYSGGLRFLRGSPKDAAEGRPCPRTERNLLASLRPCVFASLRSAVQHRLNRWPTYSLQPDSLQPNTGRRPVLHRGFGDDQGDVVVLLQVLLPATCGPAPPLSGRFHLVGVTGIPRRVDRCCPNSSSVALTASVMPSVKIATSVPGRSSAVRASYT